MLSKSSCFLRLSSCTIFDVYNQVRVLITLYIYIFARSLIESFDITKNLQYKRRFHRVDISSRYFHVLRVKNFNDEIIIVMKSCSIKSRASIIIIDLTSEANNIAHELDKRALLVDSFNEQMSKTRRLDKWAHEHDSLTYFASKRVNKFLLLYKISTRHFLKVRVQLI